MQTTRDGLSKQSLQYLWGIGQAYALKLRSCGVSDIEALAHHTNLAELTQRSDISIKRLRKFQVRATSMLEQKIVQIAPFEPPQHNVIYIDIETDLNCDKVWLIGLLIHSECIQLYADNWREEKTILLQFLRILQQYPRYDLVSYSGTNFDYRIPLHAMKRHQLDTVPLENRRHIDLCLAIRKSFVVPFQTFALKAFGAFLHYPFQHPEMDGLLVAFTYRRHIESGIPLDPMVIQYNEDDVKVLPYLIDALCSMTQQI
jgi:predicted RecB family nuclease